MSLNREIVSFPFRPHLAKYLFYTIKNQVIESEDYYHKTLDIDLNSIDGEIIRLVLQRVDFPDLKKAKQGFRLTVSVPRYPNNRMSKVMEDGRYGALEMPEAAIKVINDLYEIRFRDHFVTFVCGYVQGRNRRRGAIRQAIEEFMQIYDLLDCGYSYEMLEKFYKRTNSPVKHGVYAKSKSLSSLIRVKDGHKEMIDRYLKK